MSKFIKHEFLLHTTPYRTPFLIRTSKAYCLLCFDICTTTDPKNKKVLCLRCIRCCINIQKIFRGKRVRNKINILKQKELLHRWFISKNCSFKLMYPNFKYFITY